MKHSKLSLIVLAVLFSSISLFAQTDSVSYNSQVQFHLYGGYSLSYLNFISPNTAIRYTGDLWLHFDGRNGDGTYSNASQISSEIRPFKTNLDQSDVSANLSVQYLYYIRTKAKINFYVGSGPYINYSKNYSKNSEDRAASSIQSQSKYTNENSEYSFGLGARAVVGIECIVTKEISLLAEYGIYLSYNWGKTTWISETSYPNSVTVNKNETNNKFWGASLNSLKLGVSYRF